MAEKGALHTSLKVMKLIAVTAAALAAIATALTFFAKAETVQALDQRVWLNTSQDIVRHQENEVRWTESRVVFERRGKEPTVAETEIIEQAKEELAEAKDRHNDRVKSFENQYQQKY